MKSLILKICILISLFMTGCANDAYKNMPDDQDALVDVYAVVKRYKNDASFMYHSQSAHRVEGRNYYHHYEMRLITPKSPWTSTIVLTVTENPITRELVTNKEDFEKLKTPGTYAKYKLRAGALRARGSYQFTFEDISMVKVIEKDQIPRS